MHNYVKIPITTLKEGLVQLLFFVARNTKFLLNIPNQIRRPFLSILETFSTVRIFCLKKL